MVENLVVVAEVGDKQIHKPIVLVVAHRNTHGCDLAAVLIQREPGNVALIVERTVPFVDVEIVGFRIIAYHQIRLAVIVDVHKNCCESVVAILVLDAGLHRHVGKCAVTIVMEEMIGLALQPARSAVDRRASISTVCISHGLGPGDRQIVPVKVDISRDI